jgi:hypothetical protein
MSIFSVCLSISSPCQSVPFPSPPLFSVFVTLLQSVVLPRQFCHTI